MGDQLTSQKTASSVEQSSLSKQTSEGQLTTKPLKKARVRTRKSPLNVRKSASGQSQKIGSLAKGSEFNWTEEQNNWLKVEARGLKGWVSKAYTTANDSSQLKVDSNSEPRLLNEVVVIGKKKEATAPQAAVRRMPKALAPEKAQEIKLAAENVKKADNEDDIYVPAPDIPKVNGNYKLEIDDLYNTPIEDAATVKPSEPEVALGLLNLSQLSTARSWTEIQNYDANVVSTIQSVIGRAQTGTFCDADFQAIAKWQNANSLDADGCFGGGCFRKASALGIDMPNVHVLGSVTPHWCNNHDGFHTETSLDKLSSRFQPQAKSVLGALTKAGVSYKISATLREVGRSRMMFLAHYFSDEGKRKKAMKDIKQRYGIYVFGTAESASSANKAFGCGSNVVGFNSNHNNGDAVDFSMGTLKSGIDLHVGDTVCRTGNESDSRLKLYNAIKNKVPNFIWWNATHSKKDDPHWSFTGN